MTNVKQLTSRGCHRTGFPVLLVLAIAGSGAALAQTVPASDPPLVQVRQLAAAALAQLRGDDLPRAMITLGTATDMAVGLSPEDDSGLPPAAAGWHRRLAQRNADERFELLYEWSMPTQSRRTVRVLTTLVPHDAPPKAFARAVGERPRDNSFSVSEINGVDGLFSTAWLLVKSAEETGRLRRMIAELTELAAAGVPTADYLLTLAQIVENGERNEQLENSLRERLAVQQRTRSPTLLGKGPVPRDLMWQFGYTEVESDPQRVDIKPLPYWTGAVWQGAAEYPDPVVGWTMLDATGGHTGQQLSPVRRWVAPADGKLAIAGDFQHIYDNGDGVRGRIVSSRSGICGEWKARNNTVSTIVESLDVSAWDTIDFVTDRIDANNWDRFHWPVRLTLTIRDGEVLQFDSAAVDLSPTRPSVLGDVVLAAACLERDRLQPIGEAIVAKLLANNSRGASALLRAVLQRTLAVAFASHYPDAGYSEFSSARPLNWVADGGANSALHARGASDPIWLAHDEHILQLSGARSGALLFRYPLTGEFEFSCEAQQGGVPPTDGGLVYGGLHFLAHSGLQELTVHDADADRFVKKPCPFIRSANESVFNRLSIRSTPAGVAFTVNGHPIWEDSELVNLSPWIGLRAFGDCRPLFRNMRIAGSPVIPREVRLVDAGGMRGWQSKYFGESQPPFVSAASSDESQFDWQVVEGTIHNAKRIVQAGANPQSLLRYQRPLFDGESISYEFFFKPGGVEVHPSLGRLAFLIESDGVRLHWLTDGENEWTGLDVDNAIAEPLNRRGPKPLPLRVDAWNRVNVSLARGLMSLSLNDTVIYEHPLEPASGRQFGLFHDRRHSAVRVRNVIMTGDWPETLPAEVLADLAAAAPSGDPVADRAFLNAVFGEQDLATNVLAVRGRAATFPDEQRYSFLSDWVLPSDGRRSFRLSGAFTTTHPAPPGSESSGDVGGQLVTPAYDLIDVAARLNRLDELRDRVVAFEPDDGDQQRARCALLFLIEAARNDLTAAEAACDQLLTLREKRADFRAASLWPETLVALRGYRNNETRAIVSELCMHLFDSLLHDKSSGLAALDFQLLSLMGEKSAEPSDNNIGEPSALADWIPASVHTAKSRGAGQPPARWQRRGDQVVKLAPHDTDLLYYRTPLSGDFDVECTIPKHAAHYAGLMFGGVFQALYYDEAFHEGTLRSKQQMPLSPMMSLQNRPARMRLRVRGRTCTSFVNGREISSRELSEHYEPWLAIYSDATHLSGISDLRITGAPVVPNTIELATDEQLLGWLSYFDDPIGTEGNGAPWRFREDPAGGWIVGVREPTLAGSFKESLLQYHRPIVEDAVIEYEFYYEPGQIVAHPALDRLAFLLDPEGVKIHWVTDGPYAVAGSDPTNQSVEPEHRRGDEALPLRVSDWNRVAITLRGDTVGLTLNGQLIYERPLEVTNQRTFGLFHFADQTEVRVRRVVLRGDWPKSVPPAPEQELASKTMTSLDVARAKLLAEFSHSFVEGGVPLEYFKPVPSNQRQQLLPRADGLFNSVAARGNWTSATTLPRFVLHGDYDIEVGFEQLKMNGDLTAGILLYTEHAGDELPRYRMMLMQEQRRGELLHASSSRMHQDGNRSFESRQVDPCEAKFGRLRLARRGDTIYYLFAEGDSTMFRVVGSQQASVTDTVPEGIQIQTIGNGTADISVVWNDVTIRAEKMKYLPPDDLTPTRKLVVMNPDGSELREVTGPTTGYTNIGSPELSPDGKQLAFDATSGSFSSTHIMVINIDGTGVRDLGPGAMPSYSPDGKRIVFSQPGSGVMMMNADGSIRTDIDTGGWGGQWSPDGKFIAWGERGNIIAMNVTTKEKKRLLVGAQSELFDYMYWNLGWSRDSRSIACKARNQRTGGDDIVLAELDSPDRFKVLLASSKAVHPDFSFSLDNKQVVFAMNGPPRNSPQLFTLDRDNPGLPQPFPGQPAGWNVLNIVWSQDGKRIAFTGEKIPQPVEWPLAEVTESKQ